MMLGVNYVIYGCSSVKTTPGVLLYWSCLTLEENIVAVVTQDMVIVILFLLTYIFQYISYWSKVF